MKHLSILSVVTLLLLSSVLVSACGVKGDLVLPEASLISR